MRYNEITHFSHPQHRLKFNHTEVPFKCDGCNEIGIGSSYRCNICDYDLHLHCAIPSQNISHPFYPKCNFQFLPRPPGKIERYCNACEKEVTGFIYHCKTCGFDLHPCCAKLPMMLDDGETKLFLYRKVTTECHRCGRRGRSWTYRSTCKKYNLHVACVKEMLVDSWKELYLGKGKLMSKDLEMINRVPTLKGVLQSHHAYHSKSKKGKVQKCCEMAGLALQFIVSAVLGDPTTLIAGVVGSLMSK
ncbi:hypothetical protein Leryth_004340 [Lithospermum erythrorhizon]|uniref:Phorbol-ester/DAG-type domain-containing protein n=1 Tax=Lithospermum erythrorhizon TaxID=34254 RepID=A0AAV3NPE3_LITER|nr:hypothetical protein Leryth_004340 [Lithospermum erythrorhizon]